VFSATYLPGIHLHVVGAPVLQNGSNASEARPPSNVTFYGWQPRDTVSQMIAAADALIMPSRWEGLSLVALEAMRLGKPILSSRCDSLTEIVEHNKTGLHFQMGRPSELQDILRGLNKAKLAEMGKAARAEILHSFTAERHNAELTALYQSLAAMNSARERPTGALPEGRCQRV